MWNLCIMLLQTCSPLYLRTSWVTRKRTFHWSAPILGSGLYQMRLPYKSSFPSSDKSSGDKERSLSQSSCTIVTYQTSRNLCCNKWSVIKFSFHILIILLNMNTCDVLTAALLLSLKVERKCWMQFKKLEMCGCFICHTYQTKTCNAPMESAHKLQLPHTGLTMPLISQWMGLVHNTGNLTQSSQWWW